MIYGYFMGSMMWYKTDLNPMYYIRTRPVLANLLEWDLGGVIKKNRNPKNLIRTPTGTRMLRPNCISLLHDHKTYVFDFWSYITIRESSFIHKRYWKRNLGSTIPYFIFFLFFFIFLLEYESVHKTSSIRLLIEWRKSEIFLQLYFGIHYVIEPLHYGTYFELRKKIIFRLCSWIIFFLIFGIILSNLFFTIFSSP